VAGTPPYRWLLAESLAWPFVAEEAFDQQCIALARQHAGTLHGDALLVRGTRALAEALDEWLLPRARGWSLEALRNLRELWWSDAGERHVPLAWYLQRIASVHLTFDGARIRLAQPMDGKTASPHTEHSHPERVMRWRMLSLCLPADLLIAAVAAAHDTTPTADHVDICSPELARLLESPVAETHLHVGAALRFPTLWTGLMSGAGELDARDRRLERGGVPPFGSGIRFVEKLLAAAVARWVMARFLRHAGPAADIAEYAADARRLFDVSWAGGGADLSRRLLRALSWLVARAPDDEREVRTRIAEMKLVYRALCASRRQAAGPPGRTDEGEHAIARRDPVSPWFAPAVRGALPETHLTAAALAYLANRGATDEPFARLFWQYQRVRTQCFRFLTLRPGTEGLDWFRRHYDRISALRAPVDAQKYQLALETESRGLALAAIEMRTAPESRWYDNLREVRALRGQTRTAGIEVGLILHWIKARDCSCCGRHVEDPRHLPFLSRYGSWFHRARMQAAAVARMLEERPGTLRLLRGLDVANVELAVATWATVPLIRCVREASRRAAHKLARGGDNVHPVHVTYHAGEEYRRAVEGLRRAHELVEFGVLLRGDRIGHGLVLGEDLRRHQHARPLVPQPRQERLDDLLWEWERYAREDVVPLPGRDAVVRQSALEIGRRIYGDAVLFDDLVEARRLRHRPDVLERLGYPHCRLDTPPSSGPLRLLHRYLTEPEVFDRGQLILEVRATEQETNAVGGLQAWLRTELSACAISVESNPSSNWLVADVDDVRSHPSLVLQPLEYDAAPAGAGLALSISSDDPLTFDTCVADEYAYLHAALTHAGETSRRALDWLERARQAAWRSRFTLPFPPDA
jgi:hypothetical protein